jgi:AcrR family transcriptional regulator
MGKLIDPKRRERVKREREERKVRIRAVARAIFEKLPFAEVSLDSIGQAADVDRGVASMYFRTREELFLILLREELADWYTALEKAIGLRKECFETSEIAGRLAASLARRTELTRLLSLEAVVLEQNLDPMEAYRFQRWRRDRMDAVGKLLERGVVDLEEGEGVRLLYRTQLLASALKPAADPRGAAAYEVGDPDFAMFKLDFESELKRILTAILDARSKGEGDEESE